METSRFRFISKWLQALLISGSLCGWIPLLHAEPPCTPIYGDELTSMVVAAHRAILAMRLEEAQVLMSHAAAQVPCLANQPTPALLAQIWLQLGVARQRQGDTQGAVAAFEQVQALHPGLPWPVSYGEQGRAEYERARRQVQEREPATWRIPRPQGTGRLFVDGVPVRAGRRIRLPVGQHLLQVIEDGRVRWVGWLEAAAWRS